MVPRVLVLEPHADLRALIASVLQREHFDCDAVSSAAEATLELRRHDYAYVLVDLDTFDSKALVAGIDPASQVILLTTEAHDRGLRKPFGRAELMARFVA
jgi:DNA-binding response OmpR family regulator